MLPNSLLCAFLALTQCSSALPYTEPFLQARDVNCTGGPGVPYDSSCWETLNLSSWLKNWNATVPKCGSSGGDGSQCCGPSNNPDEPWSTCFLRLSLGNAGYDCSEINAKSCSLGGFTLSSKANQSEIAELRYVVRNIYAISNLFTTWYIALQFATTQASLYAPAITTLVDPEKKTNMALTDVLTALTAGLALLGAPEISTAIQATGKTVGTVLSIALQQAPGVAMAIWPAGTASSQTIQIGNLDQALAGLDDQLSSMMNAGLHEVMSDVPSFLAFASTGHFSGSKTPSLPAQMENLDLGLKTFILTSAMQHNYWRGSWEVLPVTSLGAWPGDRYSKNDNKASCKGDIQPNGVCEGRCDGCDNYVDYAGWVSPKRWGWTMD